MNMDSYQKNYSNEAWIGFDIRVSGDLPSNDWPLERRSAYLLRTDVLRPLSIDVRVWGNFLFRGNVVSFYNKQAFDRAWNEIVTAFPRDYLHLVWPIGISVVISDLNDCEKARFLNRVATIHAPKLDECQLLGYDVNDEYFLSGLTNCAFDNYEKDELIERWLGKINNFHLFSKIEDAQLFKNITNTRVHEHAPFYVFGLYRLKR